MAKKREAWLAPTPLLYWERPKERPIWKDCPQRRRPGPRRWQQSRSGSSRSASGPDRPAGSADCRRATPAIPSAPDCPSPCHRWGNVFSSSETRAQDLAFFPSLFVSGFAGAAGVPLAAAGLLVSLVPVAGAFSSALAALLYDSL